MLSWGLKAGQSCVEKTQGRRRQGASLVKRMDWNLGNKVGKWMWERKPVWQDSLGSSRGKEWSSESLKGPKRKSGLSQTPGHPGQEAKFSFHAASLAGGQQAPKQAYGETPTPGSIYASPVAPLGKQRVGGGNLRTPHSISNIKEIRNKHSVFQELVYIREHHHGEKNHVVILKDYHEYYRNTGKKCFWHVKWKTADPKAICVPLSRAGCEREHRLGTHSTQL